MSGTTKADHKTGSSRAVPIRRVLLNDPSQLPSDYSSTPGGTLFSTTPGGTRIIYDRNFLMQCRNSPLAKSPPPNMPKIPGVTSPGDASIKENGHEPVEATKPAAENVNAEEPQFEMDI
jgi:translation initiation factor 4E binding protein 1